MLEQWLMRESRSDRRGSSGRRKVHFFNVSRCGRSCCRVEVCIAPRGPLRTEHALRCVSAAVDIVARKEERTHSDHRISIFQHTRARTGTTPQPSAQQYACVLRRRPPRPSLLCFIGFKAFETHSFYVKEGRTQEPLIRSYDETGDERTP